MKKFRELTEEQQSTILDRHDIGPLFFKQREALKEMLIMSNTHYFDTSRDLQMHISFQD